jgi:hypothetical protein
MAEERKKRARIRMKMKCSRGMRRVRGRKHGKKRNYVYGEEYRRY